VPLFGLGDVSRVAIDKAARQRGAHAVRGQKNPAATWMARARRTSLALRHAIWRKADSAWPVCGIPDVLYVDHGSDFTSNHLDQIAADLRLRVIYSAVARPQGRGKVERLFGTLNSELLCREPFWRENSV
jgi:transposase InsO family protein